MVTLGKKLPCRGRPKIAISSGFRIVDDISGSGGQNTGGLPYKGPPIWLQTVATIIAALVGHDGKRVQSYLGTTLHQGSAGVRSYHFWQSQPHTQSPQPQESISTDHTISSKKKALLTYLWSGYGNYIGTTQPCRTYMRA